MQKSHFDENHPSRHHMITLSPSFFAPILRHLLFYIPAELLQKKTALVSRFSSMLLKVLQADSEAARQDDSDDGLVFAPDFVQNVTRGGL